MSESLGHKKVYARALDPIHIGAGGYRLGGVDNTIVRDPATDVPKIPGTSIAGVIREFYTIYMMEKDEDCKAKSSEEEKRECADGKVKTLFGDETKKGVLRFYDGQIIFFPVSSIQGTVWITTKELIEYWLIDRNGEKMGEIAGEVEDKVYVIKGIDTNKPLNLGWLLLEVEKMNSGMEELLPKMINKWVKRAVIVSDKLFSHIVNDNLEVRTSVRIDPETGTAAESALFTYEAIPRGTVFGFEIGMDRHRERGLNIDEIVEAVSPYFRLLGVGGMGTRGFGRLEIDVGGTSGGGT